MRIGLWEWHMSIRGLSAACKFWQPANLAATLYINAFRVHPYSAFDTLLKVCLPLDYLLREARTTRLLATSPHRCIRPQRQRPKTTHTTPGSINIHPHPQFLLNYKQCSLMLLTSTSAVGTLPISLSRCSVVRLCDVLCHRPYQQMKSLLRTNAW